MSTIEFKLSDFYVPLPKQREFHESHAKYKCYMGGFGSGKTMALVWEGLLLSLEYPGNYGLIGRLTYPELRDTTMFEFFNICPPEFIAEHSKTEHKVTLFNGSIIIFRNLDDPDRIKSLNLGWYGIDEMTETSEDVFHMLQSRLRKKEVPRRVGFGSTNPEGKDWVWRMFNRTHRTNPKYAFFQAPTTENPHLPDDYVDDLIEGKPEYWIKRYIKGDASAFSGQILETWDESIHCIEPFTIPQDWKRLAILDHGTNNPTACLWMAVHPEGPKIVYREHYEKSETVGWHAEQIILKTGSENISSWLADPSIWNKTLQNPEKGIYSVGQAYAEEGIVWAQADNDRKAGIEVMINAFAVNEKRLNPFTQQPGSPDIFIFKNCEWTIYELPQWRWKEIRVKGRDRNKPEEPEKANDHTVDCVRYGLMAKPLPSRIEVLKPFASKAKPFKDKETRMWDRINSKNKMLGRRNRHLEKIWAATHGAK